MFLVYAGKLRVESEEGVGRLRAERDCLSAVAVKDALVAIPLAFNGRKDWERPATRLRQVLESMVSDQMRGGRVWERGYCIGYSVLTCFGDRERNLGTPLCPIRADLQLMANPNSILAFESRFGPQSDLIDVAAFVQSASDQPPFQPGEVDHDLIQECRCVILLLTLVNGLTRTEIV